MEVGYVSKSFKICLRVMILLRHSSISRRELSVNFTGTEL